MNNIMNEKQIVITVDNAQAIVDYLKTRPYQEVHTLLPLLLNAKAVEMVQPPEEEKAVT